jgi:putative redox protein
VRTASGRFLVDEPAAVGGQGSGPNPYDLLAAALGACTVMTIRLYADKKGWPLKSGCVRVLHRSGGPGAKDRFAREIVLDGDLDDEQRRKLLEIAGRCPVHQTLERGSEMVTVLAETPLPGHLDPVPTEHMDDMEEVCGG